MNTNKYQSQLEALTGRYNGASLDSLVAVLCPILIPIHTLDKTILKLPRQTHYRASFSLKIVAENRSILQRGRTGKFVPAAYANGASPLWKEIAKGRIIKVDKSTNSVLGEIYTGGTRNQLAQSLVELQETDFIEIDQYGAAAKVLSGLAEYHLVEMAESAGYEVRRMPEDMARHLGRYRNFDFEFEKGGEVKRVEVKSLWGTNTTYARLIHSRTAKPKGPMRKWTKSQRDNYYPTSSCKFATQDIFAVSQFLRTGNIRDFAFARSLPDDECSYGLPRASHHREHVNQNPSCQIGDGTWFATIDEVWDLP
ncbi:MAG: hypothetical protein F4213_16905 [Boseongicola sp. SB0677_bin_26]|nr:hypothetical protein [Boseongicola sp. SB0665_bin_10]MYG27672.1 hypothetical protein [Boseongicola sp. SB0677_bin_26]